MQIVEPLLGTRAELHIAANDADLASSAEEHLLVEVRRLEAIFTVFQEHSALNKYRQTGQTSVQELLDVIELAESWQKRSGGVFNARVQPLLEAWDHGERTGRRPSPQVLEAARADAAELARPTAPIDNLNAIAKGWIAQAALDSIEDLAPGGPIVTAWLNLGGDIVHRGSGAMQVRIEDPLRPYDNIAPLAEVSISNEAIATSGGAHRFWVIDGQRYPKVLDGRTGEPVSRVAGATVIAPDAAAADVLATIAVVAEPDLTLELVEAAGGDCLIVHSDGSRTASPRFEPA